MARAVASTQRPDRPRHQRRAHPHLDRRGRCASCSTATSATGWFERAADPRAWSAIDEIPDDELWAVRAQQRAALVDVRTRPQHRRPARRAATPESTSQAAARAFDPKVLTIGFARRVATYKRLGPADPRSAVDRVAARRQAAGPGRPRWQGAPARRRRQARAARPVRPEDRLGRRQRASCSSTTTTSASAARLVRGCDVWLNLPRPPLEASGTSGMKSVDQRRAAAERARRVVGRGVRRGQRLGAVG